jgi:hypothetical protein
MSALLRSFRKLHPSQLATLALALVACATAQEPDDNGDGDDPPQLGGSAGSTATTSGTTSTGAGGKTTTGTAGTTAVPAGGQVSTGGTPAAGGSIGVAGTAATAGGTSTGTCPPYTGARATDSAIFMNGFGTSTMGTWSGYAYTYKYGTATIAPGMGTSCFAMAKLCANGAVPADDKSGAGVGWNVAQMMGATTTTKVAIATPIKLTFAGVTAGMRVQLSASATVSYCYTILAAEATAGTATIPLASFKTECWGTAGTAYDGVVPIEAIQIAVPGSAAGAAQTFDMCLLDVEPG